ncbi:MAG: agmatine deiminase family protein [Bacteroidales bacterium]|nr:agmatine deiminase family protein [Bacteroidales bacterium]
MTKIYSLFIFILLNAFSFGQDVYFPPEFEKQEGILLTWDYNDSRNPVTAAIAKAVQPSARVWVIYYPGQAPMDTTEIRSYLRDHGVPDENVFLIPAWTETLWIRDYGPFVGYNLNEVPVQRLILDAGYSNYNRPNDDAIPTQIGNLMGIPVNDLPLEFEGGNILTDGLGRGWGSTRIFSQNPGLSQQEVKETMEQYLGLDDMMFLEALVNSGGGIWCHVDMFMKILDSETILVSQYPEFVPDYQLIESFVDTLSKMTNANGRPYRIKRIPAPPKANGTWATQQNDEMRTYTNSIIINDVIVIPSYNLPEYDSAAKQVYRECMPGYRLEMVDATPLTPMYGALHCISKEVAKPVYLRINHKKIEGLQSFVNSFVLEAEIFADGSPDSAFVFYKLNNQPDFTKSAFLNFENTYFATIQGINPADTLQYYLVAWSHNSNVSFPPQGVGGAFQFWFDASLAIGEHDNTIGDLSIFPNPSRGNLSISSSGVKYPLAFTVQNILGEVVYVGRMNSALQVLDLSKNLMKGVYFLTFEDNQTKTECFKLLIQ